MSMKNPQAQHQRDEPPPTPISLGHQEWETQWQDQWKDRIILITGAGQGFGREIAQALAKKGVRLILTSEHSSNLQETDDLVREAGGQASLAPLDLRQPQLLEKLALTIYQRFGRLDGLVSGAVTMGGLSPLSHIEPAEWQDMLAVNLTSAFYLIRSCEPLLKLSPQGRAVMISCEPELLEGKAYWGHYAATKAGLASLTRAWAQELENSTVRVNLYNPGPMATRLRKIAWPGLPPEHWPSPQKAVDGLLRLLHPSCQTHAATAH